MVPKKRKLYTPVSPSDDVELFLIDVKKRLQELPAKPKMKPRIIYNPTNFIKTIEMLDNSKNTATVVDKIEVNEQQDQQKLIEEKTETVIRNELEKKLKVGKEFTVTKNRLFDRLNGIKFSFAKQNLFNHQNLRYFRMTFNPLGIINQNIEKKPTSDNDETPGSISRRSANPVDHQIDHESDVLEEKKTSTVQQKCLSVLMNIFDQHLSVEVSKAGHQPDKSNFADDFISQHLVKKEVFESEGDDCSTVTRSWFDPKTNIDLFEGFLKSLDDDEDDFVSNDLVKPKTLSLSESVKKIRQIESAANADYNKIITRIMMPDEAKPNELTRLVEKENKISFDHHQEQRQQQQKQQKRSPVKKIMFKDQTSESSKANPSSACKTFEKPKLVSNKALDELDRLNEKFKLDLNKNREAPLKASNGNQTYFSIFNTSRTGSEKSKLQLKPKARLNGFNSTVSFELSEEKLKENKENFQRHKNFSTYMNEFCRLKFGD